MTSSSSPPLDPANDLLPLDVGKLYPYKKLEKLVRVPTLIWSRQQRRAAGLPALTKLK